MPRSKEVPKSGRKRSKVQTEPPPTARKQRRAHRPDDDEATPPRRPHVVAEEDTKVKIGKDSVSAEAIREALKSRQDEEGNVVLEDLVEVSVLMMYFFQRLGKATVDEVVEKAREVKAIINIHQAEQAAGALQARKLVSHSRGRRKSGDNVVMWKPRWAGWSSPPEIAHIIDLLPALVATPEAQELIARLNQTEEEGDGESKAKRQLGYDNYVDVKVDFTNLDELLGSQPPSPYLDELLANSPYGKDVEAGLRFARAADDGALLLGSDMIIGWLRTGLRTVRPRGYADRIVMYIGASEARIYPEQPLIQLALPVISDNTGVGLATCETLRPGETFSIVFKIPSRGFMQPKDFVRWLAGYGAVSPIRGLSPARGKRYGKVAVTGYEVLSTMHDQGPDGDQAVLRLARGHIPEHLRAFYDELLEAA